MAGVQMYMSGSFPASFLPLPFFHSDLMRCVDHAGRTPLLWSCAQGTAPNLATLLELGDDFTALDSTDHSGLHWATGVWVWVWGEL